jgi:hypothetical protein
VEIIGRYIHIEPSLAHRTDDLLHCHFVRLQFNSFFQSHRTEPTSILQWPNQYLATGQVQNTGFNVSLQRDAKVKQFKNLIIKKDKLKDLKLGRPYSYLALY